MEMEESSRNQQTLEETRRMEELGRGGLAG